MSQSELCVISIDLSASPSLSCVAPSRSRCLLYSCDLTLSLVSLVCFFPFYIDVQCSCLHMLLTSLSIHGMSRLSPLCITVSCVSSVSISRPPPPFRVLCPLVQGVCSCDLTLSLVSFVCSSPYIDVQCSMMHFYTTRPPSALHSGSTALPTSPPCSRVSKGVARSPDPRAAPPGPTGSGAPASARTAPPESTTMRRGNRLHGLRQGHVQRRAWEH